MCLTNVWSRVKVFLPSGKKVPSRNRFLCSLAILGLRRSASTRSTRLPAEAMAMARLATVVVLPSPGIELVTSKILRGLSTSTNCRLVRICR